MGYFKIIAAILIWSSLGVFVRKAGLPTLSTVFYPAVIALVIQFLILSAKGQIKGSLKNAGSINNLLILSLIPFLFLANTLLFFFAFKHTTIANSVLTHYTAPIFVAMLAPLFLKEKIFKTTWIAIMLSSLGLWVMLGRPDFTEMLSVNNGNTRGIIAGAFSGVAYAFIILTVKGISSRFSSLFIVFVQNLVAVFVLMPFIAGTEITYQALPYLITMGLLHSTIAPILYVDGIRTVKANEAAILGYFEPVGAIILAFIFLQEAPEAMALLGGGLIILSGIMILRRKKISEI
ncbi:MAG: EamA family transporter [Thermodesulfovibrionia bacterium]|nr:EamA family transporter [Thermodesulfovibrionia bacterium]